MLDSVTGNREVTINLRATQKQRALIDWAAEAAGKNRSAFMLEAACHEAENLLADQRLFLLGDADYRRFLKALDAPPASNSRLRRLLATAPPWKE